PERQTVDDDDRAGRRRATNRAPKLDRLLDDLPMRRPASAMRGDPGRHLLIARRGRNNQDHRDAITACDLLGIATLSRADAPQYQDVHAATSPEGVTETQAARPMSRYAEACATFMVITVGSDADSTACAIRMRPACVTAITVSDDWPSSESTQLSQRCAAA